MMTADGLLSRGVAWIRARGNTRSSTRRLQVVETVSLGEKRFVAVVRVDGLQFLVGGSSTGVALLSQLSTAETFEDALKKALTKSIAPAKKTPAKRASARPGKQVEA
ncbi:MAG: flagellar biosynthetic protein FliO [Acidobacteriota bacterium]|nr:flagellar biosynthetic protein FliO [Acidobacteriota bacterium]